MKREFKIGEIIWDDNNVCHAEILRISGRKKDRIVTRRDVQFELKALPDEDGDVWIDKPYKQTGYNVYKYIEDKESVWGDRICIEHNYTEDNYPYYCPSRQENLFNIEVEDV